MPNRRLNTPQDRSAAILQESMGGCGAQYITSSDSTVSGDFVAFTVIADGATVTTTGAPALTAVDVPAGVTVFGDMKSIACASGTTVIAYTTCR